MGKHYVVSVHIEEVTEAVPGNDRASTTAERTGSLRKSHEVVRVVVKGKTLMGAIDAAAGHLTVERNAPAVSDRSEEFPDGE